MQSSDGERQKKQQLQALDYDHKTRKPDEADVSGRDRFFEKANSLLQVFEFKFVSVATF